VVVIENFCCAVSTDELKSYIGVLSTFPESYIHGGFSVVPFLLPQPDDHPVLQMIARDLFYSVAFTGLIQKP